ncbi:MAG: hypothetical protein EXS18_02380 [Verrucomicrobiae bacterium]|nr:hypothetical protein [Verrucomicrobiae bacterium]
MRTPLLVLVLTLLAAAHCFAKVGGMRVEDMVRQSELIVLAKVESIEGAGGGKRYAQARVVEIWKGAQTETVEFLASPTWTCDISEAKKGETVVLFLCKSDKSRSYQIFLSGRGRMPIRTVKGKTYATLWPEVGLPKDTPTIAGPEPKWDFIRSVEVSTLRDLVKSALPKKEQ